MLYVRPCFANRLAATGVFNSIEEVRAIASVRFVGGGGTTTEGATSQKASIPEERSRTTRYLHTSKRWFDLVSRPTPKINVRRQEERQTDATRRAAPESAYYTKKTAEVNPLIT